MFFFFLQVTTLCFLRPLEPRRGYSPGRFGLRGPFTSGSSSLLISSSFSSCSTATSSIFSSAAIPRGPKNWAHHWRTEVHGPVSRALNLFGKEMFQPQKNQGKSRATISKGV